MTSFFDRYATLPTLGVFAISAVSGVALCFHLGHGVFHAMHEWLSIVLLRPFALHIWKNWAALLGYVRRRTPPVPVAASVLAAVLFAVSALNNRGCATVGLNQPPRPVIIPP
jgi:hypothetical protein